MMMMKWTGKLLKNKWLYLFIIAEKIVYIFQKNSSKLRLQRLQRLHLIAVSY